MTAAKAVAGPIAETDGDRAWRLMRKMVAIRRFEEKVGELFSQGRLPGFVHLSIGQESVAVGVIDALTDEDFVTATHRGHGHIIAKGGRFGPMMAELMGKSTGYCKGKGGSMHIFDVELGVLGANGILGAGQPIAVGSAMSAKLRGTRQVTATFFGEGASAQGAVHEAMNTAAVWGAPVLFVAEVNGFAELTPYGVHASVPSLSVRGLAYGIESESVDGLDVLEVNDAARKAVDYVREQQRPFLLEVRTLRWRGHYEGDPQKYRDAEDLAALDQVDPIDHLRRRLLASGVEAEQVDDLVAQIDSEVQTAVEGGETAPLPAPDDAFDDIYASPVG